MEHERKTGEDASCYCDAWAGAPAAQALLLEARQVALRWLRDVQRVMSGTESAEVVKGRPGCRLQWVRSATNEPSNLKP